MERKRKNTETTKKHHKFTEFYFLKDIVQTTPAKKGFITNHDNRKKKYLCKHHPTIYLQGAHPFFAKANPNISISFSAFAKLKPKKCYFAEGYAIG